MNVIALLFFPYTFIQTQKRFFFSQPLFQYISIEKAWMREQRKNNDVWTLVLKLRNLRCSLDWCEGEWKGRRAGESFYNDRKNAMLSIDCDMVIKRGEILVRKKKIEIILQWLKAQIKRLLLLHLVWYFFILKTNFMTVHHF